MSHTHRFSAATSKSRIFGKNQTMHRKSCPLSQYHWWVLNELLWGTQCCLLLALYANGNLPKDTRAYRTHTLSK